MWTGLMSSQVNIPESTFERNSSKRKLVCGQRRCDDEDADDDDGDGDDDGATCAADDDTQRGEHLHLDEPLAVG